MSDVIGDSPKAALATVVVAMPQSVVLTAKVAVAADPINNAELSGKKAGSTIVVDSAGLFVVYVAQGGLTTDAWIAGDGSTTITPA